MFQIKWAIKCTHVIVCEVQNTANYSAISNHSKSTVEVESTLQKIYSCFFISFVLLVMNTFYIDLSGMLSQTMNGF